MIRHIYSNVLKVKILMTQNCEKGVLIAYRYAYAHFISKEAKSLAKKRVKKKEAEEKKEEAASPAEEKKPC